MRVAAIPLAIIGTVAFSFMASAALAQQEFTSVRGVVRSQDGKAIRGAIVIAESTRTRGERVTVTTDNRGRFQMTGLRRGVWSFVAGAPGYRDQYDVRDVAMVKQLEFKLEATPAGPPDIDGVAGHVIQRDLQTIAAMLERDQHLQAIAAYEAMLGNLPSLTTLNLLIGDAYLAQKDYENALAAYSRLLETNPDHQSARLAMARVHAERGEFETAEDLIRQAAEHGETSDAELEMGRLRLAQGNEDGAVEHFRKAAELAPHWARPVLEMAHIARGRGETAEAARHLERVIALEPGSPEADEARKLLEEIRQTPGDPRV